MGMFDFLFGGKSQKADWGQIERLMRLSQELNQVGRQGIWSGWEYRTNPDGTKTQVQTIDPRFQGAVDRLTGRASAAPDYYRSPEQFSSLLDAKMADQMRKHGILNEQPNLARGFGSPSGERAGRFPAPPPPPPDAPPQAEPQNPMPAPPVGGGGSATGAGRGGGSGAGYSNIGTHQAHARAEAIRRAQEMARRYQT
jgi:hypothetical protein